MCAEDNSTAGAARLGESQHPWGVRVYIVDDHPFFTFALTSLINAEHDLVVCGAGQNESEVLAGVSKVQPDMVVVDVNLHRHDGMQIAAAVRKIVANIPILFLSSLQNPQFEVDSRWLEPCSFVEKTKDPVDIIRGIRQTLAKFHLHQNQVPTTSSLHS